MSSNEEPIPYHQNQYSEKIGMIADAANVILDEYGTSSNGHNDVPIDIIQWSDPAIGCTYEIVRFSNMLEVESPVPDQLEMDIISDFPSGEQSRARHTIRPSIGAHAIKWLARTQAQLEEDEERSKRAYTSPNGLKIMPPRKDGLDPEHELEFLLGLLNNGMEILEQDSPPAVQEL